MRSIHVLGAVPFLAILVIPAFVNRVTPFIFGVPFLLAWLIFCVFLTSGVMGLIYLMDDTNRAPRGDDR